jgi:predicted integral membrane protein
MTSKNTPKSHSKTAIILFALLIFQMLFIFAMSSFGPDSSNAQSNFFVDLISNFVPIKSSPQEPNFDLKTIIFLVRKTAHFTEYAILGILFYLNLRHHSSQKQSPKLFVLAILFSALYACTDEFHQLFVPGRTGQPFDVLVDTLGATFGCLVVLAAQKIRTRLDLRRP